MRMTIRLLICVLPLALLVTGCKQKVNQKNTFKLEPGDIKGMIVDAPKKEQKIAVSIKSDVPVDVYLIQIKGNTEDLEKLLNDPSAGAVLASKKQTQDATVEGTVPAGSKFAAVVANPKKAASVDVSVTNAQ